MDLVTVRTYDNYFLANITLTKLHAAGIECYLKDEYTVTIDPLLTNAVGGIKLVVRKKNEAAVTRLLQQYDKEYINSVGCPVCDSHSFVYIIKPGSTNYITRLFTRLCSSYKIPPRYLYQCANCGYETERLP